MTRAWCSAASPMSMARPFSTFPLESMRSLYPMSRSPSMAGARCITARQAMLLSVSTMNAACNSRSRLPPRVPSSSANCMWADASAMTGQDGSTVTSMSSSPTTAVSKSSCRDCAWLSPRPITATASIRIMTRMDISTMRTRVLCPPPAVSGISRATRWCLSLGSKKSSP